MSVLPQTRTGEARIGIIDYTDGSSIDLNTIPVIPYDPYSTTVAKDVAHAIITNDVVSWYQTHIMEPHQGYLILSHNPQLIDDLSVYRTIVVPDRITASYTSMLRCICTTSDGFSNDVVGLIQEYLLPRQYVKPVRYLFEINATRYRFQNVGLGYWFPIGFVPFTYVRIVPRTPQTGDVTVRYRCIHWLKAKYDILCLYHLPWLGPGIFIQGGTLGSSKWGDQRYPYTDWEQYQLAHDLYKDPRLI